MYIMTHIYLLNEPFTSTKTSSDDKLYFNNIILYPQNWKFLKIKLSPFIRHQSRI